MSRRQMLKPGYPGYWWMLWFVPLAIAVAVLIWWPTDRVDISPVLERRLGTPTETVVPLERPSRPPHPREIYFPPGEPQPKVPGDPGYTAFGR